jgi:hypothetical protein
MATARGIDIGDSNMNRIELSINRVYHIADDESGKKFHGDTLAIQVVCASTHAKLTRELLMSGITGNSQVGYFVPRRQQASNRSEYLKVLVQHEMFRRQHTSIRIKNLPGAVMDCTIQHPDSEDSATVSDRLWTIHDESGLLISSLDPAAYVRDDWFIVVPAEKVTVAKTLIHQVLDEVYATEQFKSEFGEGYDPNPTLVHREDSSMVEKKYLEGITKWLTREHINASQVFQCIEQQPASVLKPTSYRTVGSSGNASGVSWADMASKPPPGNSGQIHSNNKSSSMHPGHAFERNRANGFGRGGGGIGFSNLHPTPDIDMMSMFTDDDVTDQTTLSVVEARLLELQQANSDQNRVIAQQNEKIDSMQKEHERQIAELR